MDSFPSGLAGSLTPWWLGIMTSQSTERSRGLFPQARRRRETAVNVKATLSPEDLARACADAMWKEDDASQGLGMEIVEVKPGQATLTMTIKPHMVNGHGIAHGGFIFLLADSAFAFACNSHNERAVAAQCNISFIRPGQARRSAGRGGAGNLAHRTFRDLRCARQRRRCGDRRDARSFPHHRRRLGAISRRQTRNRQPI